MEELKATPTLYEVQGRKERRSKGKFSKRHRPQKDNLSISMFKYVCHCEGLIVCNLRGNWENMFLLLFCYFGQLNAFTTLKTSTVSPNYSVQ
jgi:hypothetical protein